MAGRQSQIDKRIVELERDIAVNHHAITVLRSVQQKKSDKPAKVRKQKPGDVIA